MENQFKSLCDEFNIEPTSDEKVLSEITPQAVQELRDERNDDDAVIDYKGQKYTLKHLKLLETYWQEKIAADGDVLETLRQMCKVGAAPRYFEVYSSLSTTQASHLKELELLNKIITDYQVQESKEKMQKESMDQKERLLQMKADQNAALLGGGDTYNIQNNNFVVTSSQLLEMSQKADEEAKALEDSIHAEFNLE
jgi:GTPase SAR1 family protein